MTRAILPSLATSWNWQNDAEPPIFTQLASKVFVLTYTLKKNIFLQRALSCLLIPRWSAGVPPKAHSVEKTF